jgi:hypothetical protein
MGRLYVAEALGRVGLVRAANERGLFVPAPTCYGTTGV